MIQGSFQPLRESIGGTKSFTIFLDEVNSVFETNFFIRILLIGDRNPVIL